MGGGHHDLGERMKIPDYRIYKVEDVPELVQTRDLLAKRGLKDPWLRYFFTFFLIGVFSIEFILQIKNKELVCLDDVVFFVSFGEICNLG